MIILVLNCGSSSLKYQLLDMKNDEVYDLLAKGLVERIGMEVGCLKHQATGKEKVVKELPIEDHTVGIKAVIDALLDKETGVLSTSVIAWFMAPRSSYAASSSLTRLWLRLRNV